jgi:hypothetical protein
MVAENALGSFIKAAVHIHYSNLHGVLSEYRRNEAIQRRFGGGGTPDCSTCVASGAGAGNGGASASAATPTGSTTSGTSEACGTCGGSRTSSTSSSSSSTSGGGVAGDGGFRVQLGFGIHVGWAIEGAIGSKYKIDVSYLSPHVNIAARLEAATTQYNTNILFSSSLYDLLSPETQVRELVLVAVVVVVGDASDAGDGGDGGWCLAAAAAVVVVAAAVAVAVVGWRW